MTSGNETAGKETASNESVNNDADGRATPAMVTLDCSGLICPLPVLRARKALRTLESGATLLVIATDPAAPRDFLAFCREAGVQHLGQEEIEGRFHIRLSK